MALRTYHIDSAKTAGPVNEIADAANIVSDVRILDETGGILKSLSSAAQAGFVKLAGGLLEAVLSGLPLYFSPVHLTAAWASATTIDLSGMPFDPVKEQFVGVGRMTAAGDFEWISPSDIAYQLSWAAGVPGAGVLTVTGAALVNTDVYVVVVAGIEKGYSLAHNTWLNEEQSWPVDREPHAAHEETTNLDPNGDGSPGNSYYPSATGFELVGYRAGSLQYKLLDATLILQGRNHTALDWVDCTPCGWNAAAGGPAPMSIGGAGLAAAGLLEFDDMIFDHYRVVIGTFDATNTCELDFRLRA